MTDKITYRDSGVDIDAGNEAVRRIKNVLAGSPRKVVGGEEIGGIGGFSGFFKPMLAGMAEPLLAASTDSIGTKILLALDRKKLDGVGQDVVAMCVNDLIVCGARPLFFLDYIATNKLVPEEVETIIASIQRACEESDCLLIGGECAEMPAMYAPGHTDLAGFAVGIVDRSKVIDGSAVGAGDVVLGLASSGLHSNGFSLVNKLLALGKLKAVDRKPGSDKAFIESLLTPTKLYVRPLLKLFDALGTGPDGAVKACAHITGGGLTENIARVIPDNLCAHLHRDSWPEPQLLGMIRDAASLPDDEMDRTFNRGIGFVVVVSPRNADTAMSVLTAAGERVHRIGEIVALSEGSAAVIIE